MSRTTTNEKRARMIAAVEHKRTSPTPWRIDLTSQFSDKPRQWGRDYRDGQ